MEYKFFLTPRFHDAEFYNDRPVSDHIHEKGHRERLLEALELTGQLIEYDDCPTVSDWGAGNGGFLYELKQRYPQVESWGYDMSPLAVAFGREKYGVSLHQEDITKDKVLAGVITVLTETLEHLPEPHRLLSYLSARHVVASVPAFETPESHYEFHLRAWTDNSFALMFERCGWEVRKHYVRAELGTQFLVAERI
jgi:trans-aconitate methyltransferase